MTRASIMLERQRMRFQRRRRAWLRGHRPDVRLDAPELCECQRPRTACECALLFGAAAR